MRIKMRAMSAGPFGVRLAGSIHEVATEEAQQLIAGGFAEELPQIAGGMSMEIVTKIKELEAKTVDDWTDGEGAKEQAKIEEDIIVEKKKAKKGK